MCHSSSETAKAISLSLSIIWLASVYICIFFSPGVCRKDDTETLSLSLDYDQLDSSRPKNQKPLHYPRLPIIIERIYHCSNNYI